MGNRAALKECPEAWLPSGPPLFRKLPKTLTQLRSPVSPRLLFLLNPKRPRCSSAYPRVPPEPASLARRAIPKEKPVSDPACADDEPALVLTV